MRQACAIYDRTRLKRGGSPMNENHASAEEPPGRCTSCGLPVRYFEPASSGDATPVCPFCHSIGMLSIERQDALDAVDQLLGSIQPRLP